MTAPEWRLPRLEFPEREPELIARLSADVRPLWREAQIAVPVLAFEVPLREALASAAASGQLVRGLEGAERVLEAEARGLAMADRRSGRPRGERLSRLLVLADDAAERFYRNAEVLLLRHRSRLRALRVQVRAAEFGALLFGPGQSAKGALVAHREAVVATLLSLLPEAGLSEPG